MVPLTAPDKKPTFPVVAVAANGRGFELLTGAPLCEKVIATLVRPEMLGLIAVILMLTIESSELDEYTLFASFSTEMFKMPDPDSVELTTIVPNKPIGVPGLP
jgi:hypothetical protein